MHSKIPEMISVHILRGVFEDFREFCQTYIQLIWLGKSLQFWEEFRIIFIFRYTSLTAKLSPLSFVFTFPAKHPSEKSSQLASYFLLWGSRKEAKSCFFNIQNFWFDPWCETFEIWFLTLPIIQFHPLTIIIDLHKSCFTSTYMDLLKLSITCKKWHKVIF